MLFCSSCLNKLKKKRSFVPSFSSWPSANALNTFIQCLPVLPNNWDSANCIRLEPRIPASITSCISLQSSATVEAVLHTKATPKPELRRSKNSQRFTHTVKRPTQQLEKRNDCALVKRRPKQSQPTAPVHQIALANLRKACTLLTAPTRQYTAPEVSHIHLLSGSETLMGATLLNATCLYALSLATSSGSSPFSPRKERLHCTSDSRRRGLVGIAAFLTSITDYRWWFDSPLVRE